MEDTRWRSRLRFCVLAAASVGFWTNTPIDRLPSTAETLRRIGMRLSHVCSDAELTARATRGRALLELLEPRERYALGHGYLRFKVSARVVVDVVAPERSVPFWLGDQGFRPAPVSLCNRDARWRLFRKTFDAGWIGLGVNGLDRTSPAHYLVFIRPATAALGFDARTLVSLDADRNSGWRMSVAGPGLSAVHDAEKPFRELPIELAGAVALQPADDLRHSALLATGRVWKTHVASRPVPDQITIAFGADAARELVWTWRTSPAVTSTILRLVRAPAGENRRAPRFASAAVAAGVRVVTGASHEVAVPNLLNDPIVRRHRVKIDGLEPNTTYLYAISDGAGDSATPWRPVRTGSDRDSDMQFLYLGDAQTGFEGWGRLLATASRRHPRADFLILAGDLVDRGNERSNWDHFFLRAAGVFDRIPLMPCAGNHEYLDVGPRLYRALFDLPTNGPAGIDSDLVYHFECGDAFFAVLDSTLAVSSTDRAKRQAIWLDQVLGATRATWKFVIFHHPVYPSHPWRDAPAPRQYWVPIFDKHRVDMVLAGHDHSYSRTYPMRSHERALGSSRGTIYVIAVSGDKFVEQSPREYFEVARAHTPTYQTIDIHARARQLHYRAWTEEGAVIDELTIDKSSTPREFPRSIVRGNLPERQRH